MQLQLFKLNNKGYHYLFVINRKRFMKIIMRGRGDTNV